MDSNNMRLNDEQKMAIESTSMNTIVIAGAGTGKTSTIIGRVNYLLEHDVNPESILILSFTKKSAKEIQGRIGNKKIHATTFHGWSLSLLKSFDHSKISILDRDDQLDLMAIARGKRDKQFPKKDILVKIYSYCRNTNMKLQDYLNEFYLKLSPLFDEILVVFKSYEALKKERRYLDYDDLLNVAAKIMSFPKYREIVLDKIKYILIDEMQDTNFTQWEIIKPLLNKVNLYCVGDDAQSIYAFRGSNYKFVNEFVDIVPNSQSYFLTQNYRSTDQILDVSNWILQESNINYNKKLKSGRNGNLPELHIVESESQEAEFIVDKIIESKENGESYRDNMILTRSAYASRHIEAMLIQKKIPYNLYGGYSFTNASHIKDILSLLKILSNDRDTIAWLRYLTLFPNIGERGAITFIENFIMKEENLSNLDLDEKFKEPIKIYNKLINHELEFIIENAKKLLSPFLSAKWKNEWEARSKDIELLSILITKDMTLDDLLESVIFNEIGEGVKGLTPDDVVILSTIHSAKGLEAKNCFIFGANPGNYPSIYCRSKEEIEEERRVLYVALTRAKENLYITKLLNKMNEYSGEYFFKNIPSELFEIVNHVKEEPLIDTSEYLSDDLIFLGGIE